MSDKNHLDHAAYVSLLARAEDFDERDWEAATRFERHAINAAVDLRDAREQIDALHVKYADLDGRYTALMHDWQALVDEKRTLENRVDGLTAQLAAMEGERGWQPIATAPKPRIYILLYFPAREAVGVGMWSATNRGWWLTSLNAGGIADGELVPTHWMPLPAAPPVEE